jgi:hypothetical protein
MHAAIKCDPQLCSNPIGPADQHRVTHLTKPGGLQIKHTSKSTDRPICPWATRLTGIRLNDLNQSVACINRDASLGVCETSPCWWCEGSRFWFERRARVEWMYALTCVRYPAEIPSPRIGLRPLLCMPYLVLRVEFHHTLRLLLLDHQTLQLGSL